MKKLFFSFYVLFLVLSAIPASAHEVYVLNHDEVAFAIHAPRPDYVMAVKDHFWQFIQWGLLAIVVVLGIFFFSISKPVERVLDPILRRIKHYAPYIAQITLGVALCASGFYNAAFGIELALEAVFGIAAHLMSYVFIVSGLMLLLGILPRVGAMIGLSIYLVLVGQYGHYMLNYLTYAGEAFTLVIFGGAYAIHSKIWMPHFFGRMAHSALHIYKFTIVRVCFGISLVYASIYAKFIYGDLALETVNKFHLVQYFPFDPVFLVLGAMIIEIVIGLCFIIGFELRFVSLFFLCFLVLSLNFFGEAVWPHLILIGTSIAIFVHGYDRTSAEMLVQRNKHFEPVL